MRRKEMLAMLLAGGQGSRLMPLTEKVAKPAVPFGGKYRIIDFPLSNCTNSGIDTVGVLTQYRPFILNTHLGTGTPWDLDRTNGGISSLPPFQTATGGEWYKGTANAVYQNIDFIDSYNPEHVLILSGDHIYKMDYNEMLEYHKENEADVTIAALEVTLEEASRFGIMNTNPDNIIYEFEEKPAQPKSTKASMGIYIFKWEKLREYLIADEANEESENDFGHNILPTMLNDGSKMVSWSFNGYWKDVGTIKSLWEANMDLLDDSNDLNMADRNWKIFTSGDPLPASYIGEKASVTNSMVVEGCIVEGTIENSIIFPGVEIEEGAIVRDAVLLSGAKIKSGVTVDKVIVNQDVVVESDEIGTLDDIKVIVSK